MDIYRHREYRAGITLEVLETYPSRAGRNLTRERYTGRTPEAMKRYNEKLQCRKLTRIINSNFKGHDYFITLHYTREQRPDVETAIKQLTAFIRSLKRLYQKQGAELKYIRVSAFGSKGGIHHHLIINNVDIDLKKISALWKYSLRTPDYEPLYDNNEYSALANYLIKQTRNNVVERITGRKYSGSRNLKQPELIKDNYIAKIKWNEPPTAKVGYYIDIDSIEAGINELNGKPYLFYRMLKIPNSNDKRTIRAENKENIIKQWKRIAEYGNIIQCNMLKNDDSMRAHAPARTRTKKTTADLPK